jgi:hypothetical protein
MIVNKKPKENYKKKPNVEERRDKVPPFLG